MKFRTIVIIAIVGLILIELLNLSIRREPIEQLLLSETAEVLSDAEAGISINQVSFIGRDATLKGSVGSLAEKERIEKLVLDVWDVRVVDNQLEVAVAETPPPPPPIEQAMAAFRLAHAGASVLNIDGVVPNEDARNKLIQAVRNAFPEHTVNDRLTIDTGIESPSWMQALLSIIPTVGLVELPVLEVEGDALNLSGSVAAIAQRDAILEDARGVLAGSLGLNANLTVPDTAVAGEDANLKALREQIQQLLAVKRIQFRINTAELVPLSRQVLNDVADVLKEAPDVQVEIQGHTDNTGSNAMNRALSQARADAVQAYLVGRGIPAARLTAVGYGPTRPVATNTTLEGRIQNRRVVFSLKGGS